MSLRLALCIILVMSLSFWKLLRLRRADILRLQESEQRLSEAYKIAHLAYWTADLRTGKTWWSDRVFEICGMDKTRDTPSHQRFLEMIHPADWEEFQNKYDSILKTGSGDAFFRLVRPDGQVRYIHGYASVVRDESGNPVVMKGTNQDVTQSQLVQVALEETESQILAIYRNVAGILFFVGVEGEDRFRFLSVNQSFLTSTGLREDQVVGRLIQDVIPPESIDMVIGKYNEAMRTRSTVQWVERSNYPTGQKIGEVAITPIVARSGKVAYLGGIVYDVTERRRLEDDLRSAIDVRDEFMSIASHELRTPLTALSMQLQLLARLSSGAGQELDPKISTLITKSMESVRALSELLYALLDVTRIRVGKLSLEPQRMDLREAVRACVSRVQEAATQKGSPISIRAEQPVAGIWDSMRIDQVLSNLLSNAIKYGAGKPIDVALSSAGGVAHLEVQDRGIGISKDMQSKIFERFQRAISGDRITGLGLGLYIVRQIVEAHGGSIRVESEPDQGALFVVELPLERAAS